MENQPAPESAQNSGGPLQPEDDGFAADALGQPAPLEQLQPAWQSEYVQTSRQRLGPRLRLVIAIILSIVLLLGIIFLLFQRSQRTSHVQAGDFKTIHLALNKFAATANDTQNTLKVNGRLQVSNSLVLTPTAQPGSAIAGQIYYDQTSNHILYYNGQGFVDLVTTPGGTSVTNILGGSSGGTTQPAGILLQATSPGVQQVGNFNVSGDGRLGTLKTTVIDSSGEALFVNPTAIAAPSQPGGSNATLGSSTIGSSNEGPGWNAELSATKVTMGSVGGTLKSISVNFIGGSSSSHVQLAIYDDDGDIPSKPGNLLATSAVSNLTPNGLSTLTIPAIGLSANTTYWLAVNTDDATVVRTYNGGSKVSCFISSVFGFMPDPFSPGGCFYSDRLYTIFATYVTAASGGGVSQAQFSLSSTGQAVFQNKEDSSTAFQIQNAAGSTTVFNVDTINSRIAIGKATAAFKLDIAGGDINLSNGRSLRFGGLPAVSINSAGTTTSLSNFLPGGTVSIQGDTFIVQDANASHHNLTIDSTGATTFNNRTDSSAGFQIQNAAASPLLRADTSGMQIFIGNPSGSATPVILYLANKNTASDPATGQSGGLYYNSSMGSFRCFTSSGWQNCADVDAQHGFSLFDEFLGGQISFAGPVGSLGWNAVAIGANGTLTRNPSTPAPSSNRPGVLEIQTPGVANQGTTLLLGDASAGSMLLAKDTDVKTAVSVGATSGQVLRVGLHSQTTGISQPVSGVWWEADPATDTNWRYCYGNGTSANCAPTSVAITANTWVTLEIRITATGNGTSAATFVINNTVATVGGATVDTTNRVSPALSCYATAASAQHCDWDYFQLTGSSNTAR